MKYFGPYIDSVHKVLGNMSVLDKDGKELGGEVGLAQWCEFTHAVQDNNKTMYFVGNGASAMMASHMAADSSKNGGFRSQAFNEPALMTAIGNDISYAEIFAFPLQRFANPGDVLVTISSSGNSPNVIRAIEQARQMGLQVVTVSGLKPDNKSRQMGDLNFYVPAPTYGLVEASHQVLLHCWLDCFMGEGVE